jgi:predicted dehydrogenase
MNGNDAAPVPEVPHGSTMPAAVNRFGFRPDHETGQAVRIGVVGYGHWGPNIVRNLHGIDTCAVAAVCDKNPAALRRVSRVYPNISLTTNAADIMTAPDIDAVAVVTPAWTHFDLAKAALLNGKHVFIEKPVTSTSQQAEELIELADRKNLKIMVDHTFLFCGAVRKIRELIDARTLGPLYYFDSTRVNLGLFQHDVSVIWDLAPHDFSIMDHVIEEKPEAVVATGARHVNGVADLAFITVYFPNDVVAHLNLSWLSPVKVRTTLIGGKDKMLVWNDLEPDEKIRIYDKGVHISDSTKAVDPAVSYRSGDVWAPKIQQTEPLKLELEYFADCIVNNRKPSNDGEAGLRIVRLLEAAEQSLKGRGRPVSL